MTMLQRGRIQNVIQQPLEASFDPSQEISPKTAYQKKDILTGTQQILVDKDAMIALNKDVIALLKHIRLLINQQINWAQLIPVAIEAPTVNNAGPITIRFKGDQDNKVATKLILASSDTFFYDFDRPASINSLQYAGTGVPIIYDMIRCSYLSVLGNSATALYINNFAAPNAHYIAIRAFSPVHIHDDTDFGLVEHGAG